MPRRLGRREPFEGHGPRPTMAEAKRGPLWDTPVPADEPYVPEDVVDDVLAALSGQMEAVFLPWIANRFRMEWLDVDDHRLGMTRFEEGPSELIRRRKLRLDCLLYTSPSPRDQRGSRMPSSA